METKRLRGVHVLQGGEEKGKVDDRGERKEERGRGINFFVAIFAAHFRPAMPPILFNHTRHKKNAFFRQWLTKPVKKIQGSSKMIIQFYQI